MINAQTGWWSCADVVYLMKQLSRLSIKIITIDIVDLFSHIWSEESWIEIFIRVIFIQLLYYQLNFLSSTSE